jgi:hypothetical protein
MNARNNQKGDEWPKWICWLNNLTKRLTNLKKQ